VSFSKAATNCFLAWFSTFFPWLNLCLSPVIHTTCVLGYMCFLWFSGSGRFDDPEISACSRTRHWEGVNLIPKVPKLEAIDYPKWLHIFIRDSKWTCSKQVVYARGW
jgi:hypothetical protein